MSRETDTLLKMVDVLQIDSFQFFLDGNSLPLQRQKGYELRSVLTTSKKTFGVKKIFVHAPYNIYIGSKTRS
ncbi:MAG: AP endonuclease, partial [Caldisericia bacterium]|nr:AP endonuclease [Caldisericia bacterium]